MRLIAPIAVYAAMMSLGPLFGQGITLAGSGYNSPQIRVAPGQIVTLFVSNTKTVSSSQRASSIPLPTILGGFSVGVRQLGTVGATFPAALLSVQQGSICEGNRATPACSMTALTIQVPFEMVLRGDPPLPPELI